LYEASLADQNEPTAEIFFDWSVDFKDQLSSCLFAENYPKRNPGIAARWRNLRYYSL